MILRNDITNYISELRSSGQFKSALAKLITSSSGTSTDSHDTGKGFLRESKFGM